MVMSRKEWVLIALVLVLGGLWVVFFSGWFGPKVIRIEHSVRAAHETARPGGRRVDPSGKPALGYISFSLHRNYRLTSVQVVAVRELQTNQHPPALWFLAAKNGSQPVDSLAYGLPVAGMTPCFPNAEPDPLESGVNYRLLVEAGSWKGSRDFVIPHAAASR